ncbi:unnamed protein product [Caenorhabditis auriculariae]|uniref:Uncharacterized protein n=1 Tax=Caenorhabditis auriculariae TaxID=2777116 RepID=A0A8S1HRJ5_9PELO|nr:unnamed protein product [Caenorhabditis auriculariae]
MGHSYHWSIGRWIQVGLGTISMEPGYYRRGIAMLPGMTSDEHMLSGTMKVSNKQLSGTLLSCAPTAITSVTKIRNTLRERTQRNSGMLSTSSSSTTTTAPGAATCVDSLTRMADTGFASEMPATFMVNGAMVMVTCTMAPDPACSHLQVYTPENQQIVIAQVPSTFDCINNQISFMGVVFDGIFCVYLC